MREATVDQFAQDLAGFFEAAQRERILITRDGKPIAVLLGIEHKDEEDFRLAASPEFWRMIEERRRERATVRLEDIEAELFADDGDQQRI